ncbi:MULTISPECIES: 5'-methylthioadenosine/adenosylhomocysteine nucleosidase [Deefgea]|uniref:adenosylhomocysteine nucleosidase n=1 Tax=Deefgea chitinilytica TaxID=570276 RepID=A0ABS2CGP9_9NEIS|nr:MULTISPECIES: 5'-methylthioadenosine/adenosylhomocysteine nucleosidase [Deefgea]MBM5572890.1 5'-methylthioadenosine/adenosylhomocysteine nucleosidase [Deefgea chitinilytica]MBM9890126.1 5'-methylthioadenosine/adenosylhomocysteine nucleosidase [Deefgea sp. CFH1-16]
MKSALTTRLGLVFAMAEEQQGLAEHLQDVQIHHIGKREYRSGTLWGVACVCVLSGIGKVAAASTVTSLIQHFGVTEIVLSGVAGAADASLRVGDIVIADELIQHDMNAFPIFPKFEIPRSGKSRFATSAQLSQQLTQAAQIFIAQQMNQHISAAARAQFGLEQVQIVAGLIASGDQFIQDLQVLAGLKQELPDLLAVEMEGAAIAQVCDDFEIPYAIMRTISDEANEHAHLDFKQFIHEVAAQYSLGILREFCADYAK